MTPIEFHADSYPKIKPHTSQKTGQKEELHVYDCPFCGKAEHFYYFPETTTWDCKVCTAPGNNVYTFIQRIYNEVCKKTVDDLIEQWQLPRRVFAKVRFNPLNGTYVIPTFKNGKLNNLYKYVPSINKTFGTPGLAATLFDWNEHENEVVWLCEGQKDKLAAEAIIQSREIEAVGVPGANVFKEGWVRAFEGRHLVICFDNDKPGKEGVKRIVNLFKDSPYKPKSMSKIEWPDDLKEGYDIHDLYIENKAKSYSLLNSFSQEIVEEEATKVTADVILPDDSIDTFVKAMDVFESSYYMTKDMRAALSMVLASIYSNNLDGREQVWLKIIGPPGCGKSTISNAVSASDFVQSMSTFTGLFSGWKDNDDKDPSLVPLISNRTLIVKDADALLKQGNIEKIMSELRDFYDKNSTVRYGNRQMFNYQNVRSTFILMGTQHLRGADQSFLGERMLTVEMDVTEKDQEEIENRVMKNALAESLGGKATMERDVMAGMKGWIDNHLKNTKPEVVINTDFVEPLRQMCRITALMRTQVDRDFKGKVRSPAIPELPTRLIGQMIKTAVSLTVVHELKEPDEEVYNICKKVLKDTLNPRSTRFTLCDLMIDHPGICAPEIAKYTNFGKTTINDELRDLIELDFVDIKEVMSPDRYPTRGFFLKPKILKPLREIISK
jgi:hypothetical protein